MVSVYKADTGKLIRTITDDIYEPDSLAFDDSGNVCVTEIISAAR